MAGMGQMMAGMGGMGNFASMFGGGGGGGGGGEGGGNNGMMSAFASMMGGNGAGAENGAGAGNGNGNGLPPIAANMIRQQVTEAVHYIVGPEAKPDQAIIAYATTQGRVPSTMFEMLPYMPYLQKIALTSYGPWLEAEAAAPPSTNGTNPATGPTDPAVKAKNLVSLKKALEATVMRRAVAYMNRPQTQQAAAGAGMMAAMGRMIPNMIRGIAAQYM
jgi:hypothetical protein